MELDTDQPENQPVLSDAGPFPKQLLIAFLTEHTAPLLGTIRSYVQRMGLAKGEEGRAVALEVLQEVVVEALDHAERFRPSGQAMAWLLGIAMNVIKRKRAEFVRRSQHEMSIVQFSTKQGELLSEGELFDLVASVTLAGPEQTIEADEQALTMLSLVSAEDQHILSLVFLADFDRELLAAQLGITPVAARVRLHRALGRLRVAWCTQQLRQQEGESNG